LFTICNPSPSKKEALLVGVSDYGGDPRNDLIGIELDIAKMRQLFTDWGFDIKILPSHSSFQTKEYLQRYADTLSSGDTFAFYYSGHGSFVSDENGDEVDKKDEALVLSDGVSNIPFIDDELNHYLNNIQAKKLIIFDSCHNGTVNRGDTKSVKAKTQPLDSIESMSRDKLLSFAKDSDRAKIISKAVEVVDEPIQNRASGYFFGLLMHGSNNGE
jgi:hypothetical protein